MLRHNWLAASVSAAALCVGPSADAAIAIISGGGTGGSITSQSCASGSGACTTSAVSASVPAGSLSLIGVDARGSSTIIIGAAGDSQSNTYAAGQTTSVNNNNTQIKYSLTGHALANGVDTENLTWGQTTNGKTIIGAAFSGASASPYDNAASTTAAGTSGASGAIAAGTTGALTVGGVIFANLVVTNTVTVTDTGCFVSLGSLTTEGYTHHAAYCLVTGTTPISYAPSLSAAGSTWANQLQVFDPAGAAGSARSHMLMGTGQ